MYKWSQVQEVGRVKAIMAQKDRSAKSAIDALDSYYKASARIDRTVIKKVIQYVPTSSDCNVGVTERRMLNTARTGVQ